MDIMAMMVIFTGVLGKVNLLVPNSHLVTQLVLASTIYHKSFSSCKFGNS